MPELPEVETIKKQLNNIIIGKKIKSVEILEPRLVKVAPESFKKAVIGATIKAVRRRAKLLIIDLSGGRSLLVHLKMTGQLIYDRRTTRNSTPYKKPRFYTGQAQNYAESIKNKHTHVIYTFADGGRLLHNDLRKFGFVKLAETKEVMKYLEKEGYGPEPLENNFTLKIFKALLTKQSRKKIKPTLMEQTFIAGIGNIYADEICFYAGVGPTRIISTLKEEEIKKLFAGIKKILSDAVKYRGSSVDQYVDARGEEGEYVPRLKVYGREGEKCPRCGAIIQRIKINGRSSHFCSKCQR